MGQFPYREICFTMDGMEITSATSENEKVRHGSIHSLTTYLDGHCLFHLQFIDARDIAFIGQVMRKSNDD